MSRPPVVIIAAACGLHWAREFRKLDGESPLVMLSSDHGGFYSKPMLSNAFAQKKDANALLARVRRRWRRNSSWRSMPTPG